MDPQTADPFLAVLRRHNVPFVTIGREPDATEPEWCVDSDMVQATTLLLDHFAAGGSCRPALILSAEERSYSTDALLAYSRWTAERGLAPVVVTAPERQAEAGGERAMARLLADHPDVNAVFIPLDPFAPGLSCANGGGPPYPAGHAIGHSGWHPRAPEHSPRHGLGRRL